MPAHSPHADDALTTLASSPLGSVTTCAGCGVVHLHLPVMTLRFEPAAFHELARLLAQACQGMGPDGAAEAEAPALPRPPAAPPRWH